MKRLLLFIPFLLLLAGCGGGSSPAGNTAPSIVGRWRVRNIQVINPVLNINEVADCPGTVLTLTCGGNDTWTFNADGTAINPGGALRTYTTTGNTITLSGAGTPLTGILVFTGNNVVSMNITQNNTTIKTLMERQP